MKVIIINGKPTVGKSLFAIYCQEILGINYCRNISTVDRVKKIASMLGWNGSKTPKDRKFLSDLKDLLTEWNDIPFKDAVKEIENFKFTFSQIGLSDDKSVIFIHCREPEEIQKFKQELNAITLLIRRPDVEKNKQSNHADSEVYSYDYDYTIVNDGTKEDFKSKAYSFLKEIKVV